MWKPKCRTLRSSVGHRSSPTGLTRSTNIFGDMNIYVNADDVNSHEVSRRKENTKKNQTSQQTGSESKKNTRPRSVQVCLVVLCVLLLTAVIVLCVLIYTNNHQFHINNNITQQRDQLLINITQKRDQLLTNNTNIEKEKEELQCKIRDLNKHIEQLNQDKNDLLKCLHERDGWINYRSSIYFISSEKKAWTESRSYCRERGADLVIINNKDEQDFIKNIYEEIWIGLSDSDVENTWKWVDGSLMTSSSWRFGEPNGHEAENCVMSFKSVWYDYPCNSWFKWICKKICI